MGRGVPLPTGVGSGEGAVPPPQKIFSILELKIATFGAFWVLFFTVHLPVLHAKKQYCWAWKTCCCMHCKYAESKKQNMPL